MSEAPSPTFRARLGAALVVGALLGAILTVVFGFALLGAARLTGDPEPATRFREYLASGGWLWVPLWSTAIALVLIARHAIGSGRVATVALAAVLAALPVVFRPALPGASPDDAPRTPQAKARSIRRWSFRNPEQIARIVALSRDPNPHVRQQAALAMGENRIVSDVERASELRPSRLHDHPVRDSLRLGLLAALVDPVEDVRAEAARALWKAPRTFGTQPAAAETLAAMLDRARRPEAVERLAWLALDAAGGAPHSGLRTAAERFAHATPDTALASAARRALARSAGPAR